MKTTAEMQKFNRAAAKAAKLISLVEAGGDLNGSLSAAHLAAAKAVHKAEDIAYQLADRQPALDTVAALFIRLRESMDKGYVARREARWAETARIDAELRAAASVPTRDMRWA